ncbi:DUF5979 domain-containing protein [Microbacterium luticocti]|uniref:DUF5979 domain-containing protein n=1 Tax=Microbacterium luticocti TaxID=451764 RepID=UPI0004050A27|nr:DUF5979 domain-containing protein [Microbacterium luticocti]
MSRASGSGAVDEHTQRVRGGRFGARVGTRLAAVLGTVGVVLASVIAVPAMAQAAGPNDKITVGEITISPADAQAKVGDTLTISGAWDASHAQPQAGDTFTIGLPPELGFTANVPFELRGENSDGVVTTWANCLTAKDDGLLTCTLTAAVKDYPEWVKGTFEFDVNAVRATEEKDVVFSLNGAKVAVPLPGGGGIDDGITPPTDWTKTGVMNANQWSMGWTIDLPGGRLRGHDTVHVADTLSDDHVLCEPSGLKLTAVYGDAGQDITSLADLTATGDHAFTIELSAPDGGWDAKTTYRITYNTCTPDGQIDPKGTEYTNEATVDVWGESSGVIGVTQDRDYFTANVSKSGSVLGGAERNGTIAWTIAVDGDRVAGHSSVTLTEALGGDQELCASTVENLQVVERYGPSGQRQKNVTDQLEVTPGASTDTTFTATIAPKAGSSFTFQASPYVYLVQYRTCVTTDGLPVGGQKFGNTASIDGTQVTGTATTPGRADHKTGQLNGGTVRLDGVDHLPQTTLGWTITVPGERLTDLGGALTVTDVLSPTQIVCAGTGGDLVARLGLTVRAVDQISGGGLKTQDLTGTVTATQDGATLTVSIPQPTLPTPGGDTATGFSREYQYVIGYTTCTASGGMDAVGTIYDNEAVVAGKEYSSRVEQNNRGSGTGQGSTRGSVAVVKHLADTPGAALVPADTAFTVHAKEIDPTGAVQNEYDLTVPLDGDPVSGPNPRGTGWTIQLSEPTMPKVAGVVFGDPVFTASDGVVVGDGGTTATATITPATNIAVTLTNTAQLGSLRVVKAVDGPAADRVPDGTRFPVTAHIDTSGLSGVPAPQDRSFTITAGVPVVLDDLPVGAVVTLTEGTAPSVDGVTWGGVAITGDGVADAGDGSATVTVTGAQTDVALTTVTNTAQWTPATFSLHKAVTGPGADLVPGDTRFTVHVAEVDPDGATKAEYDLTVGVGDNEPVTARVASGPGWTVRLSEPTFPEVAGTTFGAPVFTAGDDVTVDEDGTVATAALVPGANTAVSLTNTALLGAITVTKKVDGPAADRVDPQRPYQVTATVDVSGIDGDVPAQPDRTFTVTTGQPHTLEDLPIGATVTFAETLPIDDDVLTWAPATFSPESVTVTADAARTPAAVSVTNHVTRTVGTFALSKTVAGAEASNPAVPDEVTVTATWNQEGAEGHTTLTLPTDGTPVPLGEQLLIGTKVTLTEAAPADGAGIAWGAPVWSGPGVTVDGTSAVVTVGRDAAATVTVENHAATSTAGISVLKGIAGAAADEVDPATTFPVTAAWTDADGAHHTRELQVSATEPTPLGVALPHGTVVTLTEHDRPQIDTVRWGSTVFAGADVTDAGDGSATVVVADRQDATTLVTLTNEADWAPGSLSVAKTVTGVAADHAGVPGTVTVTAAWTDADGAARSAELTVPTDGTAVPLGRDLPYGTEVTLSEAMPADAADFTWNTPAWAGERVTADTDGSARVVIGAADVAAVTVTNTVTAVRGTLTLDKVLAGAGASAVPKDTAFPVTLTWTDLQGAAQQRAITVTAGSPTVVDDLPVATPIQVTEGTVTLPKNVGWTGVGFTAGDGVTVTASDRDAVVTIGQAGHGTLVVTNTFTKDPGLAMTGMDGMLTIGIGLAAVVLVAGGVLLLLRRRRTA